MPKTPPLTAAAIAAQTGIPKRTIQHAITQGALKAQKLPGITGTFLVEQRDLDKWLAKRAAKASA